MFSQSFQEVAHALCANQKYARKAYCQYAHGYDCCDDERYPVAIDVFRRKNLMNKQVCAHHGNAGQREVCDEVFPIVFDRAFETFREEEIGLPYANDDDEADCIA